jgi:uncharacterized protein (TIGR00645 family)
MKQVLKILRKTEVALEKTMYMSRWLLAPVYLGMSLALFALSIKFFQELLHFLPRLLEVDETELILKLLTLIDLTLVGSLIVIVMFSGYENFVSQLDLEKSTEKLDWLGSHDYGSLKMKVASSIVAISSIHLLKIFMNVETTGNDKIMWYVIIHLTLVLSALLMGYLDKISRYHE